MPAKRKGKKPVRVPRLDAEVRDRRRELVRQSTNIKDQVTINRGGTVMHEGKPFRRGKNDPHVADSKRREPHAVQFEENSLVRARRLDDQVHSIDRHNALTKRAARRIQDSVPGSAARKKRNAGIRKGVKRAVARRKKK